MEKGLVSIIIPIYNGASLITETLGSVIDQTYTNWECIIVDEGSEDDTAIVVKRYDSLYPNIFYLRRKTLLNGVSVCRNLGLLKAVGEFVIFLDADDLLDVNCLKNRLEFVRNNQDNDFWVFNMEEFISKVGDLNKVHNTYPEIETSQNYLSLFLKGVNPFAVTSPLWRKTSLEKIKGFNEQLHLWEDPELHIRALLEGLTFKANRNSDPDCFYRNDRGEKARREMNPVFLKKLFRNTWIYFDILGGVLKKRQSTYKLLLAFNILTFIQKYTIENRNTIYFFRFYFLLVRYRLISFRTAIMLLTWFLFSVLQVDKIGRYSKNSLRKRIYYLVGNGKLT
ncbi:glycosyltransferase family 2 protein [Snuella lapsa]|uniref:Glycosyltransferase 2-like domain-containing protein n=1 Tax=Snuella lapsa TaxID=870481 RepID=A0ABP6XSB2_9FLAO